MDYLKRVIADLTMYPMSLYESGESTGDISLEALFDNPRTDLGARSTVKSPTTVTATAWRPISSYTWKTAVTPS